MHVSIGLHDVRDYRNACDYMELYVAMKEMTTVTFQATCGRNLVKPRRYCAQFCTVRLTYYVARLAITLVTAG